MFDPTQPNPNEILYAYIKQAGWKASADDSQAHVALPKDILPLSTRSAADYAPAISFLSKRLEVPAKNIQLLRMEDHTELVISGKENVQNVMPRVEAPFLPASEPRNLFISFLNGFKPAGV